MKLVLSADEATRIVAMYLQAKYPQVRTENVQPILKKYGSHDIQETVFEGFEIDLNTLETTMGN